MIGETSVSARLGRLFAKHWGQCIMRERRCSGDQEMSEESGEEIGKSV
jgi:hypothetical protein